MQQDDWAAVLTELKHPQSWEYEKNAESSLRQSDSEWDELPSAAEVTHFNRQVSTAESFERPRDGNVQQLQQSAADQQPSSE